VRSRVDLERRDALHRNVEARADDDGLVEGDLRAGTELAGSGARPLERDLEVRELSALLLVVVRRPEDSAGAPDCRSGLRGLSMCEGPRSGGRTRAAPRSRALSVGRVAARARVLDEVLRRRVAGAALQP
jgi:hypothetical protein